MSPQGKRFRLGKVLHNLLQMDGRHLDYTVHKDALEDAAENLARYIAENDDVYKRLRGKLAEARRQLELERYERALDLDDNTKLRLGLEALCRVSHEVSTKAGWWHDPVTGEHLLSDEAYAPYVIATKLHLITTEVSEATEGFRKDLPDDKLRHRSMLEVELVDVITRAGDLAKALGLNLAEAFIEKAEVNRTRNDHKTANRRKPGGKKF